MSNIFIGNIIIKKAGKNKKQYKTNLFAHLLFWLISKKLKKIFNYQP